MELAFETLSQLHLSLDPLSQIPFLSALSAGVFNGSHFVVNSREQNMCVCMEY